MSQAATGAASVLLESLEGGVLTLCLNRPDKLNALNPELGQALASAVERAAGNHAVRAVILTGAGRAFCAGGDLAAIRSYREQGRGNELEPLLQSGARLIIALRTMNKPVIAAINGAAAGGGMNVALGCDIRIASEQAMFAQSFAKVGLFPDFGGTYTLPRLVGEARAAWMMYTGDLVNAQDALRMGIVDRVVPAERVVPEAQAMAAQLAAAPPLVVGAVKRVVLGAERELMERKLAYEVEQQMRCFASEDCAEGLNAFFEKRPPKFTGK